ncbi:hypothetical protein D5018_17585 [Parashewanella curva]|uniref:Alpha/beta hydrolase n=1 Tax=Parashewanella curva TaxID=2338552 RepID=A0A3L8PSI4_9GAMM|nr:hypothetical protein [Parashewanella curva]RLV58361.1 hypothetical protein D5018_17585 [Parashewanella curva]
MLSDPHQSGIGDPIHRNTHSGRTGGIKRYEKELFKIFTDKNLSAIYLSYPGQDGAKGRVDNTAALIKLLIISVKKSTKFCNDKIFFYGRSLGSMLATIVAIEISPDGLILEGASPSLSAAIRNHLNLKWYLKPYTFLPIESLLADDIKIEDYLKKLQSWLELLDKGEITSGFWAFYPEYLIGSFDKYSIIIPTWNHLWYVVYLLFYTLMLIPVS